jgi:hypothetical protein
MPKIACSPAYVDYRPKTNAVVLLDMGHTLRGERTGRNRERKGNLKLGCGRCAHCSGVNIVILNWQRPLWEGDKEAEKRCVRDESMWVEYTCAWKQFRECLCLASFTSN